MKKVITKIVFFIFFLNKSILNSQIPTELNHLSNIIAKRLAARAEVDLSYFDQNHKNYFGIIMDDIMAGLYSMILIYLISLKF